MATLLDGLQRYYRLDSNGTEEVSAQNGVPSGAVTYSAGKRGTAANFNADNSRIITAPGLNLLSDLSLSVWIFPTTFALSNFRGILNHGTISGASCNYALSLFGAGGIYLAGNGAAQSAAIGVTLNAWTHVVATRTAAGAAKFYLNGTLVGTSGAPVPPNSVPGASLCIGNQSSSVDAFPGLIDEVAVYNTVLTQNHVTGLFGEGTPPDYADFGDPLPEMAVSFPNDFFVQNNNPENIVLMPGELSCHERGQLTYATERFSIMYEKPSGGSSKFNPGFN